MVPSLRFRPAETPSKLEVRCISPTALKCAQITIKCPDWQNVDAE